jgi:putative ubiquitin-RnfH superfamily antitoxin RatB of RatAB toxin-antitoxin module
MDETRFEVEVCWIGIEPPLRIALSVAVGCTVAQALARSGIAAEIAQRVALAPGAGPLDGLAVTVYGRPVSPADLLQAGDRVELLPPLTVDPMVARQRRAEHRRRETGERRWARDRELPARPPRSAG